MNGNEDSAGRASQGLLIFRVGGRRFALPDTAVVEIMAALPVTPLPFAPPWVGGLVNAGGRILPQIDLGILLGEGEGANGGEIIVAQLGRAPCALRVDVVEVRAEVAADAIHAFAGADADSSYVRGELNLAGGAVLLLDAARFDQLFPASAGEDGSPGLLGNVEQAAVSAPDDGLTTLLFHVGDALYALPLTSVSEIGEAPTCTAIPGAPATIAGIGILREQPLLLRLAALLGDSGGACTQLLVLERPGVRVGLLVDAIAGIRRFPGARLRRLGEEAADVVAVLHDEAGRIAGLLDPAHLLGAARLEAIRPWLPAQRERREQQARARVQHLQFQMGGETFAIALDQVERIAPWVPATLVDEAGGVVSGLVNMDGAVVPVLDSAALGIRPAGAAPEAWIVLRQADRQWALAADRAQAIVNIPVDSMETVGAGRGLVHAVATVDGRLLSILSVPSLGQGVSA